MKQEDQRKKQGTILDRSKRFLGTLAYGCLEGRRREGVTWVQQRCQWSEAKAEFTSVLRLHDATNAYLSMKHDVAKQAAKRDGVPRTRQCIFRSPRSSGSGTISNEECEIDILVRSGIWHGDFCAPRIFVKATCSAFPPEKEVLEKGRKSGTRSVLKNCPITSRSTPLGTSVILLGAVALDTRRWQPPAASCSRGVNPFWSGPSGCREETENPQSPTANAEGPNEAKHAEEFFDPWKEWSELHEDVEGEDDPRAGMDMDDAEAVLLEEPSQDANRLGQDPEDRPPLGEEGPTRITLRQERDGACHLDAASLGFCR